jgi:hypothetical protein
MSLYRTNLYIYIYMRSTGNIARIGAKRHGDRFHLDNLKERGSLKNIGVDGRTILKRISRK